MFSHSQQHGHIPEDLACRSNYIKHACNFPLRLQDHIPLGRATAGRMGPTHEQPAQSRALSGLSPWLLVWEVLRMEEVSTSNSSWEVGDTLLGSTCCPVALRGRMRPGLQATSPPSLPAACRHGWGLVRWSKEKKNAL